MGKRVPTSYDAMVTYVGEMATELARMAGAAQCTKLAYILEVAALEAKTTIEPPREGQGRSAGLH